MFPVTAETTVSVSERAHLPSNMFSIPQAERCAARLRKRPPTEQMAEPWNTGDCERLRKSLGWSPWQEQQEEAVGGILDKLHFTETATSIGNQGLLSFPALLSFSSIHLPFSLPSISLLPFLSFTHPRSFLSSCLPSSAPSTSLSCLFLPSLFPPLLSSSSPSLPRSPSFRLFFLMNYLRLLPTLIISSNGCRVGAWGRLLTDR